MQKIDKKYFLTYVFRNLKHFSVVSEVMEKSHKTGVHSGLIINVDAMQELMITDPASEKNPITIHIIKYKKDTAITFLEIGVGRI